VAVVMEEVETEVNIYKSALHDTNEYKTVS